MGSQRAATHPELRSLLTPRQREVLALIASGGTNYEIAQALGITLDGVKWHVREILARLDVDSREAAAAAWRDEQRLPARVGRAARSFAGGIGLKWLVGGAAALAVVGGALALVLWQTSPGGSHLQVAATTHANSTASATATAEDPDAILKHGSPVPFKVCASGDGWTRPTTADLRPLFTNRRFGDGTLPYPVYWTIHLANFVYVDAPTAISANIEINAFTDAASPTPSLCGQAPPFGAIDQELRVFDYHVTSLLHDGNNLRVEVARSAGHWESIDFASFVGIGSDPKHTTVPFANVDVVDGQRHVLAQMQDPSGTWQSSEDGSFGFATAKRGTIIPVKVTAATLTLDVYASTTVGSMTGDEVIVTDMADPDASRTVPLHTTGSLWEPSATITLATGSYTLEFGSTAHDGVTNDAFVVLPSDGPVPGG
ncbi:helix-turn-helix transcriptional regulator [bacterium]|nr:helix-turn-helix transcriptional regulator [bacterium]